MRVLHGRRMTQPTAARQRTESRWTGQPSTQQFTTRHLREEQSFSRAAVTAWRRHTRRETASMPREMSRHRPNVLRHRYGLLHPVSQPSGLTRAERWTSATYMYITGPRVTVVPSSGAVTPIFAGDAGMAHTQRQSVGGAVSRREQAVR